ncbi:type II toxin-antitoxin system HicB family antitoxin [Alteromonadaceae bacterium M269]|nr:type II toxin-antitoxin system HicB family antitoxin [Alteromonadaceae bacterium M269]
MSKTLEYKGYQGSAECCTETDTLDGKILHIKDLVTYSADSMKELRSEFELAVDDYLELCEELGKEPLKPYKGSLNVRIGSDLHTRVAASSAQDGVSINDWIKSACEEKLDGKSVEITFNQFGSNVKSEFRTETQFTFGATESWSSPENSLQKLKHMEH